LRPRLARHSGDKKGDHREQEKRLTHIRLVYTLVYSD
jgi:hypothetical protein